MKRLLTLLFAFLFLSCMSVFAQDQKPNDQSNLPQSDNKVQKAEQKEANAAAKGKDMKLTGWVKDQDGKNVFVNDKDKTTWDIQNPEAVKGHEGHHVSIKAKLDESNHSLTVDSLKMMKKAKQADENKPYEKK